MKNSFVQRMHGKMISRFLSVVAMCCGIGLTAAAETVEYWDPVGKVTNSVEAAVVTADTATLTSGWYVVVGTVSRGPIAVNGEVNLILADGCELTAKEVTYYHSGINVASGAALNIYAQSVDADMVGQISAIGGIFAAGIGGDERGAAGAVTINGGRVTAQGGHFGAGIGGGNNGAGGEVTINGGVVTATGGKHGAGIGGGINGAGGRVTINGGTVTAFGYSNSSVSVGGAGIGGGDKGAGGMVTISGGTVTAMGGKGAAGIGGGAYGAGGEVTISGGTVTATGGDSAAGIGGGLSFGGGTVTINGGVVMATGGDGGAGIGGGGTWSGAPDAMINDCTVTINGGVVTATGSGDGAGIGGGNHGGGGTVTIRDGRLDIKAGRSVSAVIGAGNQGSQGTVTISGGVFAWRPNDAWLADRTTMAFVANPDAATSVDYPWAAGPIARVALGRPLEHMSAAWTSGDGSLTNAISGTTFEVLKGSTDVKVIFMPEDSYRLDKTEYVFSEPINEDCTIPAEDMPTVTYAYAVVTVGLLDHMTVAWTSGDGSVTNAISGATFVVLTGTTGVRVIFTPRGSYEIDKTEYAFAEPIIGDCAIPTEALPTAQLVWPEGYVRVEYIESTVGGGQYVDTGVKASSTLAATMDYMAFEHTGGVNLGMFGADSNADWRYFDYSGGPVFSCGRARAGKTSGNTLNLNVRYVVNVGTEGENTYLVVTNDETKAEVKSFKAARSGEPSAENVFVFGGLDVDCTPMRLYSLTLRDFANVGDAERTTLAEFVPCVRTSDRVAGLYDVEGGRFVENEGSGFFVAAESDMFATVTMPSHAHVIAFWTSGDESVTNAIRGATFGALKGEPFKVLFAPEAGAYALVGPSVYESDGVFGDVTLTDEQVPVVAGGPLPVKYIDADGSVKSLDVGEYVLVTETTSQLTSGWYVVGRVISRGSITVNGDVNLILADGCELTATGGVGQAGVFVGLGHSLTIYGQVNGTGKLIATGGETGAGIGGQNPDFLEGYGSCGVITVNGGMVTATGGKYGAGIGYGSKGADGTVTINGGTVKATGGYWGAGIGTAVVYEADVGCTVTINGGAVTALGGIYGAGIGGGFGPCAGGEVTISGGTVTATGGEKGAGIGGGCLGDGGTVLISGGRLDVMAGDHAAVIGEGGDCRSHGTVMVLGGIFSCKPNDEWLVDQEVVPVVANPDAATCEKYPWAVDPTGASFVSFGKSLEHMTAAWTSGDGSVSKPIGREFFAVPKVATGVKVIFTPEDRYGLDKTEYPFAGPIDADCEIPAQDLPTATYLYVTVTVSQHEHVNASWTSGDGSVTNAIRGATFEVLKGEPFKVLFASEGGAYALVGPSVYESDGVFGDVTLTDEQVPVAGEQLPVKYIDADGSVKSLDVGEYVLVTETTSQLTSGWYVVGRMISRGSIAVNGDVNLILADGCELTATGGVGQAGIAVGPGHSLTIYGQVNGTGKLTAKGGRFGAGIGGGNNGAAGAVTIINGRFDVKAGDEASEIGAGRGGSQGTVTIYGGIFSWRPQDSWLADQSLKVWSNHDSTTCATYPWAVLPVWNVGEDVTAYVDDNMTLIIGGTGAMVDFASAADVPWNAYADKVAAVEIGDGVTHVGKNAFVGLADAVTVNVVPSSFYWMMGGACGMSVGQSPSGAICAGFESIEVLDGTACLGVSVKTNVNLTAEAQDWGKVGLEEKDVSVENGSVIIAVPANTEQGFMVLESSAAK